MLADHERNIREIVVHNLKCVDDCLQKNLVRNLLSIIAYSMKIRDEHTPRDLTAIILFEEE